MLNRMKILVIAVAVAGSASNAFAENIHHRDHVRNSKIEHYGDPQLSEGRNSAPWWAYSTNWSTDRESIVETPGN
jgi:hypothetical protein